MEKISNLMMLKQMIDKDIYKKEFRKTAVASIVVEEDTDRKKIKEYISQPKTNVINTTFKGK